MKACGISLYRIAAPLLVLSLVWSGVLFGLEQRIMARANRRADALDSTDPRPAAADLQPAEPPLAGRPRRRHLSLQLFRSAEADARSAGDLPAVAERLEPGQPDVRDTGRLEPRRVDGRRRLAAGIRHRQGRVDAFAQRPLALETPDYFETEQPIAELMTVPQLKDHIDELSASGFNVVPLSVDLQKKLAFPFVTFVMTLLAIPFGMTTGKRGTLYGIGIGIVLALSYWTLSSAFAAIGKAGPPQSAPGRLGPQRHRRRQRRLPAADDATPE